MWCDCSEFYNELLNSSKEMLAEKNGMMQWKMFKRFLMKHITDDTHQIKIFTEEDKSKKEFTTPCSLKICSLLVHTLDEFRSRGGTLAPLLVDLMTIFSLKDCSRFYIRRIWDFDNSTSFSSERNTLRVISSFRCTWNINSRHGVGTPFMELLLKFGFLSRVCNNSPRLTKQLDSMFLYFMCTLSDDTDDEEDTFDNYIINLKNEAIKLVRDRLFPYVGVETDKRIFLAGKAIHSILDNLHQENSVAKWYADRLKMYFTGTIDAYLSVFEVASILHVCLKLTRKLELFNTYCQKFLKLMPECRIKMQPRSLTHLCRCQIRDNLKASHLPLPSAIDKLVLPEVLKSYLLGEIAHITKKRNNAASQSYVSQMELALLMSEISMF